MFLLWLKKQWNAAASVEWRHFQENQKKRKILDSEKNPSVHTIFQREENLGNFHIFPLPMNSKGDRKDSPRKWAVRDGNVLGHVGG